MPRPRKSSVRRRSGWSEGHIEQLRSGHCFFPDEGFGGHPSSGSPPDFAAMQVAWESLRVEIMSQWIDENPGTRCYAWWQFDAPEPRHVVEGYENPCSGYPPWRVEAPERSRVLEGCKRCANPGAVFEAAGVGREYYFGTPNPISGPESAVYESEPEYLQRLGLLGPSELKRMPAEEWERELGLCHDGDEDLCRELLAEQLPVELVELALTKLLSVKLTDDDRVKRCRSAQT